VQQVLLFEERFRQIHEADEKRERTHHVHVWG